MRGKCGIRECVVRMWLQGGMWASGGNAAAASGNAASRDLGMWRHNMSSASGTTVLHHLRVPCNIIKGSLGGETSVLRTFRMSGKELVKERVSKERVRQGKS